ncbi:uncharacterized protein LOC122810504 [Protopterus annectens]|uniref:uncharacterized protein LOC122810504 n=1 Tax=Protopterus annectens TaxID=7888 RepID=UPI001CFB2D5B|nr:uncharacterized protein LOC122810504 [Protopterus annectens]
MEEEKLRILQICGITVMHLKLEVEKIAVDLTVSEISTVRALAGEDALLNCILKREDYNLFPLEPKNLAVLWKADEEKIVSFTYGETKAFRKEATLSEDTLKGNMSLLLKNVSFTDEAKYTCEIVISPYIKKEQVELHVSGQPSVIVSSQEILEVGDEASLVCDAVGFYPQEIFIKWFRRKHGEDTELSTNECLMSPIKLPNGTFSRSLQVTAHATSDDVEATFVCAVQHRSFDKEFFATASLIVKEPENKAAQAAIASVLSVCFSVLLGFIIIFVWKRYFTQVLPKLSEITAAKPIVHKEKCELKIAVDGFKPDYIEVAWHICYSGIETKIGSWKPSKIPFVFGPRKMINSKGSEKEDWRTVTSSISKNSDGTFSISSSVIFLPDIDRDPGTTIICSVFHKSIQGSETKKFCVEEVSGVPPKVSKIVAPEIMMNNQVGTLICPISSFQPQSLSVAWFKLVKDHSGCTIKKIISQFEGPVQEADRNVVICDQNYTHRTSILQLPEQKCCLYSMLAFKPTVIHDDNAEYACEVNHMKLTSPELRQTSLKIRACPIADPIVCNEPSKIPVAGKPFKLECTIHSFYPEPITICWLKDGEPLPIISDDTVEMNGPDENNLYEVKTQKTIIPAMQDKGKKVVCKADHETLLVKSEFTLCIIASSPEVSDIQCKPEQPVLGEECILSCQISNFYPQVIKFIWYKIDGSTKYKLGEGGNREDECNKHDDSNRSFYPELRLTPAMDDYNSEIRIEVLHASLTCPIIKSYFFHFPGMPVFSQIALDPETPKYGKPLSLNCTVDGLTTNDIMSDWLLEDKEVTKGYGVKRTSVNPSAGGTYCMQSSVQFNVSADHFEKEFTFRVQDKKNSQTFKKYAVLPLQPVVPSVSDITCDKPHPKRGEKITLSCTASNFSPDEIRFVWCKDLEKSKMCPEEEIKMNRNGLYSAVSKFHDVCNDAKMEITYTCAIYHIKTGIIEKEKTIQFS